MAADRLEHESREEISSSRDSLLQRRELQMHTAMLVWRPCFSLATLIQALEGFLFLSEGAVCVKWEKGPRKGCLEERLKFKILRIKELRIHLEGVEVLLFSKINAEVCLCRFDYARVFCHDLFRPLLISLMGEKASLVL